MSWEHFRPVITVVDVLETGVCFEGVSEWVEKFNGVISAPFEKHAKNGDGDSYGNSYGYGYGYGDGNGDGDGDGYSS